MPLAAPDMPRKMLPPPMTRQTWTPRADDGLNFLGDADDGFGIQAVTLIAHQAFAGQLDQDAAEFGRIGHAAAFIIKHLRWRLNRHGDRTSSPAAGRTNQSRNCLSRIRLTGRSAGRDDTPFLPAVASFLDRLGPDYWKLSGPTGRRLRRRSPSLPSRCLRPGRSGRSRSASRERPEPWRRSRRPC